MADQYPSGGDGRTGFVNLGNTCYMSSVFQCLSHTDPLRHWFLEQPIESLCHFSSNTELTDGWVAYFFVLYLRQVWTNNLSSVRYYGLKQRMGELNPEFAGTLQCDAQEFLGYLVNQLHRDLNGAAANMMSLHLGPTDTTNLHSQAAAHWAQYKSENDSVVVELFFHQLMNTITCGNQQCRQPRHRFEETNIVTVSVENTRSDQMLETLLTEAYDAPKPSENLLTCDFCGQRSTSQMSTKIWSLPRIMVMVLKRFNASYNIITGTMNVTKIDAPVVFPIDGLDMSPYCHPENQQNVNAIYDLYGIVNHVGGAGGGHYIAYARTSHGAKRLGWRVFDDNKVKDLPVTGVVTEYAYLLFYKRRGD